MLVIQIMALAGAMYSVHRADLAMDKSGVGDLILWQWWNNIVGLFFWLGLVGWVLAVAGSAIAKWKKKEALLFASEGQWTIVAAIAMLPPLVFVGAMFIAAILL
jgi:hypothetical protein